MQVKSVAEGQFKFQTSMPVLNTENTKTPDKIESKTSWWTIQTMGKQNSLVKNCTADYNLKR